MNEARGEESVSTSASLPDSSKSPSTSQQESSEALENVAISSSIAEGDIEDEEIPKVQTTNVNTVVEGVEENSTIQEESTLKTESPSQNEIPIEVKSQIEDESFSLEKSPVEPETSIQEESLKHEESSIHEESSVQAESLTIAESPMECSVQPESSSLDQNLTQDENSIQAETEPSNESEKEPEKELLNESPKVQENQEKEKETVSDVLENSIIAQENTECTEELLNVIKINEPSPETVSEEKTTENQIEKISCDIEKAKEDEVSSEQLPSIESLPEPPPPPPVPMETENEDKSEANVTTLNGTTPSNLNLFSTEDSNMSSDSDGLVIDQEASYPKAQHQVKKESPKKPSINGLDFTSFLKRKISSAIEEGIQGPPAKRSRARQPRQRNNNKNNGRFNGNKSHILGDYLLHQQQQQSQVFGSNRVPDIFAHQQILDVKQDKIIPFPSAATVTNKIPLISPPLLPAPPPPPPLASNAAPTFGSSLGASTSSSKDSRNDPNPRRKVFLCSSCNQHYENWNLFLHMRDIHKRFTCLYCMGIFNNAEKLLAHLENKHNVSKKYYNDKDDILNSYRNMYNSKLYLMCIECEHVFDEADEFTHHSCEMYIEPCPTCGLRKKCKHKGKITIKFVKLFWPCLVDS